MRHTKGESNEIDTIFAGGIAVGVDGGGSGHGAAGLGLDVEGQRKTPRAAGLSLAGAKGMKKARWGHRAYPTNLGSVIVQGNEAPEQSGLGAGGVALADEFGGVDGGSGRGGRLEGIGGNGDGAAEEGGFLAAAWGRAGGAPGGKEK